jgi:hypothetical protein
MEFAAQYLTRGRFTKISEFTSAGHSAESSGASAAFAGLIHIRP